MRRGQSIAIALLMHGAYLDICLCRGVDGSQEIRQHSASHASLLLDSDQSDRGAEGEPQGAKLALHSEVWKPSRALGQLASSNVREEARAGSMERLTLRCTDTYLALFSGTMAYKAVWKEMKGDGHRQTLGVVISGNGRAK